jgi:hypothetical protein
MRISFLSRLILAPTQPADEARNVFLSWLEGPDMTPDETRTPPELPEGRPRPNDASPGGTEGADAAWTGGQSNLGDMLNPQPAGDTSYSTKDVGSAGRRDSVRAYRCEQCEEIFDSATDLASHRERHRDSKRESPP